MAALVPGEPAELVLPQDSYPARGRGRMEPMRTSPAPPPPTCLGPPRGTPGPEDRVARELAAPAAPAELPRSSEPPTVDGVSSVTPSRLVRPTEPLLR